MKIVFVIEAEFQGPKYLALEDLCVRQLVAV